MADPEKCAHPSCNCMVAEGSEFGKYCSQHCETAKEVLELKCDCGHPACEVPIRVEDHGHHSVPL